MPFEMIRRRGCHRVLAIAAAAALLTPFPASAAVLNLDWTGQFAGFTLTGQIAFDETEVGEDGVVRSDGFTDFDFSLFDGDGNLIRAFEDDHLSDGFNANFDTNTGELLQSGRWDGEEGLSIGDARGEGLNIWSIGNPLEGPDVFDPHLHVTDWQDEFTQYAIQFGDELSGIGHIEGAFFLRTAFEVTGDPADGDALGQMIMATPVPLPGAAPLMAGAVVLFGWMRRRARA